MLTFGTIGQNIAACKGKILRADKRQDRAVDIRRILRENLTLLLEQHEDNSKTLARRAHYLGGTKRGKRVSERTIRYILDPSPDAPSPSLDGLAAIASAFGLSAWSLLLPGLDPSKDAVTDLDAQIEARAGDLLEAALHEKRQAKAQAPKPRGDNAAPAGAPKTPDRVRRRVRKRRRTSLAALEKD